MSLPELKPKVIVILFDLKLLKQQLAASSYQLSDNFLTSLHSSWKFGYLQFGE